MSSGEQHRRSAFDGSSDDEDELRKPWELCAYCRRMAALQPETSAQRRVSSLAQHAEDSYLVNNFSKDVEALKYARNLRRMTRMKNTRRSSVPSFRGYPATITNVVEMENDSLLVKWALHDSANVAAFELFVDDQFYALVENPKRSTFVLSNVDLKESHRIQLRVKPIVTEIPTPRLDNENEPLDHCTCHFGRVLMRRSKEINDALEDWSPSTYYYSPDNN